MISMRKGDHYFLDIVKIVWISLWATLATLIVFFPVTIASMLSKTGNLAFTISKIWAHIMLKATCVHPVIRGREKIIKGRSYIIISNHQSEYDILAIVTTLGIQFRWIIKKELLKVPLFGYALYKSRNIFIDRGQGEAAMKSIREGMKRLPEGVSLMFFAEGTRSEDGAIQPFKKGGFVMALEKGIPVLPVTVNGSRKVLPKKSLVVHPGPIEVVISDPIETSGFSMENLQDLIDKTRDVIISNFKPDFPEDAL
jgi:1-acyl-sn-glycerol-3-phosphate acyltransferase